MSHYALMNGEERALAHPDTFFIPSRTDRHTLAPGDWVKLGFVPTDEAHGPERMWLEVSRKLEGGPYLYEGVLGNSPAYFAPSVIKHGDRVLFSPEHVLDFDRGTKEAGQ